VRQINGTAFSSSTASTSAHMHPHSGHVSKERLLGLDRGHPAHPQSGNLVHEGGGGGVTHRGGEGGEGEGEGEGQVYASASVSSMLHAARSRLKATSSLCISQTRASQTLWERDEDEPTSSIKETKTSQQVQSKRRGRANKFNRDAV